MFLDMPPTGSIDAGRHTYPVRIYFEDTDAAGIVYHARYLHFAERARTEMLRLLGLSHATMVTESGMAFVMRRLTADYAAPAKLDDALDVVSRITHMGGASLDVEQTVERAGMTLVRMDIRLVCIDRSGKATRLPEAVRRIVAEQFTAP